MWLKGKQQRLDFLFITLVPLATCWLFRIDCVVLLNWRRWGLLSFCTLRCLVLMFNRKEFSPRTEPGPCRSPCTGSTETWSSPGSVRPPHAPGQWTHRQDTPTNNVSSVTMETLLTLVSGHCVASHTTCMMKCLSVWNTGRKSFHIKTIGTVKIKQLPPWFLFCASLPECRNLSLLSATSQQRLVRWSWNTRPVELLPKGPAQEERSD